MIKIRNVSRRWLSRNDGKERKNKRLWGFKNLYNHHKSINNTVQIINDSKTLVMPEIYCNSKIGAAPE